MWGHVTSDLWWGCQLVVDVATSGRAAALYVLAWLKHNHTLLTRSQPVWWREGRAQGGCRRHESRVEAQETQHDRRTHHMYTGRKTQGYAHTYGTFHKYLQPRKRIHTHTHTHTHKSHQSQWRWKEDTKPAVCFNSSWYLILTMTSVLCLNCLNHFNIEWLLWMDIVSMISSHNRQFAW